MTEETTPTSNKNAEDNERVFAREQYKSLRDEIVFHMDYQRKTVLATVAFTGTVIGFGIQQKFSDLLFVYPSFAFIAALIWVHESACITQLSRYIECKLEGEYPKYKWEEWNRKDKAQRAGFRARHIESLYVYVLFGGSIIVPTVLALTVETSLGLLNCQIRGALFMWNIILVFLLLLTRHYPKL